MEYSTYVGPYVQCRVETTTEEEPFLGCTNGACVNAAKDLCTAFCPECGAPRGERIRILTVDVIDDGDVEEILRNVFRTPNGDGYLAWSRKHHMHVWIVNHTERMERDPVLDSSASFSLSTITREIVHREIAGLAAVFSRELKRLREVYGEDAVRIRWGIVQDYC